MPAVKKKPAAKTAAKGKGDWFHKKSPAAQKAYIAKHPNSIYAKQAKKAGASKAQTKEARPEVDEKAEAAAERKALKKVLASRKKEPKLEANIKDNSPEKIKEHDAWLKKHREAEREHANLVRARRRRELAKDKADWEAKKRAKKSSDSPKRRMLSSTKVKLSSTKAKGKSTSKRK